MSVLPIEESIRSASVKASFASVNVAFAGLDAGTASRGRTAKMETGAPPHPALVAVPLSGASPRAARDARAIPPGTTAYAAAPLAAAWFPTAGARAFRTHSHGHLQKRDSGSSDAHAHPSGDAASALAPQAGFPTVVCHSEIELAPTQSQQHEAGSAMGDRSMHSSDKNKTCARLGQLCNDHNMKTGAWPIGHSVIALAACLASASDVSPFGHLKLHNRQPYTFQTN